MATGDTIMLLKPLAADATATSPAGVKWVQDASTPNALTPVLTFADGVNKYANWSFTVPKVYSGGGFDISWKGGSDNTNTGTFELEVRIKVVPDATALTADLGIDTQTAAAVTDTPPATANALNYAAAVSLTHANAGSPTGGTSFVIVNAYRDYANDTNTGALQIAEILISET